MLYRDTETNEIKTKAQWLDELDREARSSFGDAYPVFGGDLFLAMLTDGILQPLSE